MLPEEARNLGNGELEPTIDSKESGSHQGDKASKNSRYLAQVRK